jgi:hypothetical protein
MEECSHVLKQFIQSGLMNSEEGKTECPHKIFIQFMNKFMNIKISKNVNALIVSQTRFIEEF